MNEHFKQAATYFTSFKSALDFSSPKLIDETQSAKFWIIASDSVQTLALSLLDKLKIEIHKDCRGLFKLKFRILKIFRDTSRVNLTVMVLKSLLYQWVFFTK